MIMAIYRRESVKLGENIEDIINFAEVKRISINLTYCSANQKIIICDASKHG